MSAQSSHVRKILGPSGSAVDRMTASSRSAVAAARLHPAGFAFPSMVIVAAVAFFTFVTAVVVRVFPPSLFGAGSPPTIQQAGTNAPKHRVQPQPALTGPPIIPAQGDNTQAGRRVPGAPASAPPSGYRGAPVSVPGSSATSRVSVTIAPASAPVARVASGAAATVTGTTGAVGGAVRAVSQTVAGTAAGVGA